MIQVVEDVESPGSASNQSVLASTRKLKVYDDGIAPIQDVSTIDKIYALYGTATTPVAMPRRGLQHPNKPGQIALDDSVDKQPDHPALWEITWTYVQAQDGAGAVPGTINYVDFSHTGGREFSEAWREDGSLYNPPGQFMQVAQDGNPIPFQLNPVQFPDILGVPLDSGGEPGTALRFQVHFQINEIMKAPPSLNLLFQATGARNSIFFFGIPKGYIVMLPPDVASEGPNKYKITWKFAIDEYYHMVQRPVRGPDGEVIYKTMPDTGISTGQARYVFWHQPFRRMYDFNRISPNWFLTGGHA